MTDRFRIDRVWLVNKAKRPYLRYDVVDYRTNKTMNAKPMTRPKASELKNKLNENPPPPEPVKLDSRICFGIAYFLTQADAMEYDAFVKKNGNTYNGGFFHGMPCGRTVQFDYYEPTLGRLYAVTQ